MRLWKMFYQRIRNEKTKLLNHKDPCSIFVRVLILARHMCDVSVEIEATYIYLQSNHCEDIRVESEK